jgi:hypothetical protein
MAAKKKSAAKKAPAKKPAAKKKAAAVFDSEMSHGEFAERVFHAALAHGARKIGWHVYSNALRSPSPDIDYMTQAQERKLREAMAVYIDKHGGEYRGTALEMLATEPL